MNLDNTAKVLYPGTNDKAITPGELYPNEVDASPLKSHAPRNHDAEIMYGSDGKGTGKTTHDQLAHFESEQFVGVRAALGDDFLPLVTRARRNLPHAPKGVRDAFASNSDWGNDPSFIRMLANLD